MKLDQYRKQNFMTKVCREIRFTKQIMEYEMTRKGTRKMLTINWIANQEHCAAVR
jgi:hypothetical protein